ncbi:LLM class flavin-dependent oxidoreductase [Pedococcus dokdonensis]|uniref:LLM class flavin-dependent oxidoreductase n=1 Tax=Pedococcus dokdonensis TaxID=443156 RepID=UPI000B84A02B|nr:LLM class flavin-dependent oxidoreductase [Pedococcus dokdonensis]
MRYGFVVPYADPREFAELAALGEERGWDAVFTWESLYGEHAWVTLAAAAMATSRIRLGTLLTPASRHRPWDLASMVGSVDRLSGGRVVMTVGLGALHSGWTRFEPDEGRATRARKLDESLEVYRGLLSGDSSYTFAGEFYPVGAAGGEAPPSPVPPPQRPHPPVWVVGSYDPARTRQRSLERAARWQGVLPTVHVPDLQPGSPHLTLDSVGDALEVLRGLRDVQGLPWEGYDVVIEGDSTGEFVKSDGTPQQWADLGATWWIESWWSVPPGADGLAEIRRRVAAGPPR